MVVCHQQNNKKRGIDMKKVALRDNRFRKKDFSETNWTKNSKNLGEYIFRRISLDQSDKSLQEIRPRHILSGLIINSSEIQNYVCDYLDLLESQKVNVADAAEINDFKIENLDDYPSNKNFPNT
jgi:hypothetical protein